MTEGKEVCKRYNRADEREKELMTVEEKPCKTLPRHSAHDSEVPRFQFMYCKVGRTVVKKHSYITPITYATYPWNYAHPPGRKAGFKMPRTIYPQRQYQYR